MRFNRVFSLFGFLLVGFTAMAQSISTSPYSAFGPGELINSSNIEHSGMAGLSLFSSSPFNASANFYNPAANSKLSLTSFKLGTTTHMAKYNDGNNSSNRSTTYISDISLAFPVGQKARAGFGFQPYSSTGYEVSSMTKTDEVTYANGYTGSGGINSLHVMGSYNITPEFTVGIRGNYLFGKPHREELVSTENLDLVTDYSEKAELGGLQFTGGMNYVKRIGTDRQLEVAGTFTLASDINARVESLTATYVNAPLSPANYDTVQYRRVSSKMRMPHSASVGIAYKKDLKWMLGAQMDWADWGGYQLEHQPDSRMNTSFRVAAGGYWIPNFNSYKSYFDRVVYRAGGFYESTPLKINDQRIVKYGVTVGADFPIGKARDASMLNFALEMGQLGKSGSGIIKENFANLKIGFTLNDVWFRKRVID